MLTSPVGAYFSGDKALRILIKEDGMRAVPGFGSAKTGGNYAAALKQVIGARTEYQADQVLFCPGGGCSGNGCFKFHAVE